MSEPVSRILNSALDRLKTQNELASIRAVAMHLQLSPSYLNKVFRGERKLQPHHVPPLARTLRLDLHEVGEIERLLLEDFREQAGFASGGAEPSTVTTSYETLGKSEHWLLEEPHHIALLNLATTKNFSPSPAWIAQRLEISEKKAAESLAALIAEGYLSEDAVTRTKQKLRFPTDRSYPAVRKFHASMIEQALDELESPSFPDRLITGVSFAGDPAKLAEAKLILEKALFQAAEVLASGPSVTEVFQLNLQLFKVSLDAV